MNAYHVHYTTGSGREKGDRVDFTTTSGDLASRVKNLEKLVDKGEAHSVSVHDVTVAGKPVNVTHAFVPFTTAPRREAVTGR